MSEFWNWDAGQWSAFAGAIGAIATTAATLFAAKAARAAERSIHAQFQPQIVLQFIERNGDIFLRVLNAGGPAQRITIDSDPPLANSKNHLLTDQSGLRFGIPLLLHAAERDFLLDGSNAYFDIYYILYGRPLDFHVTVQCWSPTLSRRLVSKQLVSLRPLQPRTPRTHRGMDYALTQIERWSATGPAPADLSEQEKVERQLEQALNDNSMGYLRVAEAGDLILGHIGWRIDARHKDGRLLMAEKLSGVFQGERIAAAGWTPAVALTRLIGFALDVNKQEQTSRAAVAAEDE